MGLPDDWQMVRLWLSSACLSPALEAGEEKTFSKKRQEIPTLADYRVPPESGFWDSFPHRPLPLVVRSTVNVRQLELMIQERGHNLTCHQRRRAERVCVDLRRGGGSFQKTPLPPTTVPNGESLYVHGALFTEKLATWIEKGFVCGPFPRPPVPGFRSNTMMAVEKKGSVRPVMNMSAPKGSSFNDAVVTSSLERVHMSTAQSFGYSVREAGRGAVMSKFDLTDAFKTIPAKKSDWRLQGFSWLGRFFVEIMMVFGAVTAVSNFDRLGNTIRVLTEVACAIPRVFLGRTLDDFTAVGPRHSGWCEQYSTEFKSVCKRLNVQLADLCPLNEKAFENQTNGVVLGIRFNSENLSWSFPEDKGNRLLRLIAAASSADYLSLGQMQELMGSVNDLAQMCPILKAFRHSANRYIGSFGEDDQLLLPVPTQVVRDLAVCSNVAASAVRGLPIPARPGNPPIGAWVFTSDAAGSNFVMSGGTRWALNEVGDRGVASIGTDEQGNVRFWSRVAWPLHLLNEAQDGKGCYFGSKTATLEAVGLLLPFLTNPEQLLGRHVILRVDNKAVVYGWGSKGVRNDVAASILIRALYLIGGFLSCTIHVAHLPRMSSELGTLADHLSRVKTSGEGDIAAVSHVAPGTPHRVLLSWLEDPQEDWELANRLLAAVEELV